MNKSVSKYQPTKQVQTYAKKISKAWRQAFEGILEAGRLLQEAHDRLEPKAWLDMINNDLPFERRTAEKLLKIASDKRIINQKHIPHLPPRWTTLHELTFLTDPQFKKAISSGQIHPDMERKEAEKLTARNKRQAKAKKKPVVIAKMPKQKHGNGNQVQIIETDKIDQLAVLKIGRDLTDEEASKLEDELNKLSEDYGFSFTFSGYPSKKSAKEGIRKNLANAVERWMSRNAMRYNKNDTMTPEEVTVLEAAIGQLETGKYLRKLSDGSFHAHDVRNPDNSYHEWYELKTDRDVEWGPECMYDLCCEHRIITKFTPLEFVDYEGYLQFLVFQHSVGNAKQQKLVETKLEDFARQELKIREADEYWDKCLDEGIEVDLDKIPAANTNHRSPQIDRIYGVEPGYAEASLRLLVR